jgi:hypothetical protein
MHVPDKVAVLQAFVMSSHYYGRPISDEVAAMYQYDVRDLPAADVVDALDALRREPKRRMCPLPAEVRALCERKEGGQMPEQVAARIAGSISRFGYTRPKAARAYIGETGWRAIEDLGGWSGICSRITTAEMGTFTAQARELCRAHQDSPAMPRQDVTALPENTERRLMALVGGIG